MKGKVKNLLLYFLGLIVIIEGIGFYFYFRKYKIDEGKIAFYIESLNFILREGGGFRFSVASRYINPEHYAIRHMTEVLKSPEEIYLFCAHEVKYNPTTTEDNLYDYNVLMETRESNCAGHSNLLCSLLRAKWTSAENCRVVYGSILKEGQRVNHSWVKLFWNGQWIILDSTNFTPIRHFGGWTRDEFYRVYQVVPVFEYNDTFTNFRVIE
ncbi:MAG TPA: hypothetical protein DHV62_07775 [Elusimicrobia bacterium]|nr:hypothetical protein [Elusimicrobiota bacterium]